MESEPEIPDESDEVDELFDENPREEARGRVLGRSWRRPDLPDDIAWVASRTCLYGKRQEEEEKKRGLLPSDYRGCPSPFAKLLLAKAFANPDYILDIVLSAIKNYRPRMEPDSDSRNETREPAGRRRKKKLTREEAEKALSLKFFKQSGK